MTCPHNFEAWNHQLLAQLATDQYNEIVALKEELKLALEAYRLTVIGVEAMAQELEAAKRVMAFALKELNTVNSVSDMAGEFDFVIQKLREAAGVVQQEIAQ